IQTVPVVDISALAKVTPPVLDEYTAIHRELPELPSRPPTPPPPPADIAANEDPQSQENELTSRENSITQREKLLHERQQKILERQSKLQKLEAHLNSLDPNHIYCPPQPPSRAKYRRMRRQVLEEFIKT